MIKLKSEILSGITSWNWFISFVVSNNINDYIVVYWYYWSWKLLGILEIPLVFIIFYKYIKNKCSLRGEWPKGRSVLSHIKSILIILNSLRCLRNSELQSIATNVNKSNRACQTTAFKNLPFQQDMKSCKGLFLLIILIRKIYLFRNQKIYIIL